MRFVLATVLAVASVHCAVVRHELNCGVPRNRSPENYILQGDDALPGEFPWQVSLQEELFPGEWSHICGASIISKDWLLTAAHCVMQEIDLSVVVGAHDISRPEEETVSSQMIDFSRDVIVHPRWNFHKIDFDYALIQLPEPLDFTGKHAHLTPICMPRPDQAKVFENMQCTVTGWGLVTNGTDAGVLQKLPVRVPTDEECSRAWSDTIPGEDVQLTARHICAATTRGEGSGICYGDSGGPLQCDLDGRSHIAGIASFGGLCGSISYPSVYARVTEVLDWIEQVQESRARE